MKTFTIQGKNINSIADFYKEINRLFMQAENWPLGESLNALDDLLYGGFGALKDEKEIEIIWQDANLSRKILGKDATVNYYQKKIEQPEIFNAPHFQRLINELKNGDGPTYFDIIIDIMRSHPNIHLQLNTENMNTTQVKAFGTESKDADLKEMTIELRELQPNDVEIDILYCGVCHSDLHTARNDWGGTKYPSVPGHEIIGRVTKTGADVSKFKEGDLVGVGCLVDSCRECSSCRDDLEQYCLNGSTGTYNGKDPFLGGHTFGGYSEKIVVTEDFVLRIPENLDVKAVAPLLCAGVTTWSPLIHWKVGPNTKVAVIGLGGLGHMAIKLAKGLGAHVSLFSRSPEKTQDAMDLGCDEVIISTDSGQMQAALGKFDLIIDTVPYDHDINPYIKTLTISGTLVLVGLIGTIGESLSTRPLIGGRRSVAGSVIGGIKETQEMLDFCGDHNIVPEVEMIKMQEINAAYERMLRSDVRYRFVIDMKSLK